MEEKSWYFKNFVFEKFLKSSLRLIHFKKSFPCILESKKFEVSNPKWIKIEKVSCRRARALQNCSRPHFSETHKNLVKTWIFGAKMEFRDKTQPDER